MQISPDDIETLTQLYEFIQGPEIPDDYEDFIGENGDWKCNQCGACCGFVSWVMPPEDINEFGVCKHLQSGKICGIYEDRPHYCVVQSHLVSPITQAKLCSKLRSEFGNRIKEGGY